jgi:hypothetical protein
MVDRPVVGQIARTDALSQSKIEIIGELTKNEWAEFFQCMKDCVAPFTGRIAVRMRNNKTQIKVLKLLPRKKKQKPTR